MLVSCYRFFFTSHASRFLSPFSSSIHIYFSHGPRFTYKREGKKFKRNMKYFALEFSNFNSTFYNWIQTGLISFNRNCQTINMFFMLYCHWNRLDMAWPGLTWLCLAHNTNVFDQCWRMLDTTYATYAKHFMEYLSFGVNWQLYLSVVPIANLCFSSESNFMWIFFMMFEHNSVHYEFILCRLAW